MAKVTKSGIILLAVLLLTMAFYGCESNGLSQGARMLRNPPVLEKFDFSEEFFQNNTLILVPFGWPHLLYENLRFYTVFVENDRLNFLIEIPKPDHGGDRMFDGRVFAVIIPNEVFNKHEIGESIVFKAYESRFNGATGNFFDTKNCREWLSEVEKNAVEHRAGYAWFRDASSVIWYVPLRLLQDEITVISTVESLQEYFIAGAAE